MKHTSIEAELSTTISGENKDTEAEKKVKQIFPQFNPLPSEWFFLFSILIYVENCKKVYKILSFLNES